jgi:hypothetical protein
MSHAHVEAEISIKNAVVNETIFFLKNKIPIMFHDFKISRSDDKMAV